MSAKRLCAVLVGAMAMAACTPARLAVPEPLAREAQPVKVEKEYRHLLSSRGTLKAGEYVAAFDEDGQSNSSITFGAAQVCRGRRAYRFELGSTERATPLKVECEEQMSGQKLATRVLGGELSVGDAQNRVSCRLEGAAGHVFLEHAPGGDVLSAKRVAGQVAVGAVYLTAESVGREAQGLGPDYLGFQLRRDGQVVGMVQTRGPMQLWLSPELRPEEREVAVLGAFALLLQRTWSFEGPRDCDSQA
jgi:hypothetical protein